MFKRIMSIALVICVMLSCIIAGDYTTIEADAANINYGLVDNVQYGQILHCWNWSFDNIRRNLPLIASQGFTAVQTSPIQASKESTRESWSSVANSAWVFYQPIGFYIEQNSWNALGTKSQFEAMCQEAHKYGIKVIVDAVLNHLANDTRENTINGQITSDLRDDSSCWNNVGYNCSNWEDRYDVTHNCLSGLPDLNTANWKVQGYAINFMKECIDAGADGFRFDAAKHIETPSDNYGVSSDFWPNVFGTVTYHAQQTRGITPYYYGELLGSPGGGLGINAYTEYMSVTDNNASNNIRHAIERGDASGACIAYTSNGAAADKAVQWNESHDTYYADNESIWVSNYNMKKTWAIVGSRAQICGLYLARPENNDTTMLGDGDITAWADKEVRAINRFKNYFAGHPEYLTCSGNIVYNERGNSGVVLVNASGGSTSVNVPANRIYNGTYTDAITGNLFNVSNGTISGTIGDSGIAVVYSYPSTVFVDKNSQSFRGDTLGATLTYNEATSGTYSINDDYAKSYTYGDKVYVGCGMEYGQEASLIATATGGTTVDSTMRYYKKIHPDTELRMYIDNSNKNWNDVYAYIYNVDGQMAEYWPGLKMDYDSTRKLYYVDVPEGFETCNVVFNNNYDAQTPSSGGYYFNAYTSICKDDYFYGYNTGVSDKLYFRPSNSWKSDNARFAAYVWNSSFYAWVDFTDLNQDGVYEADLPVGVWTECIFMRMDPSTTANNWENAWNQTGDMGISNKHNYFRIAEGWDTSDGTWSIIDNSKVGQRCGAYLSGSFNDWSTSADPFVYTDYKTAEKIITLPAGTYQFKMVKDGKWFGNPGTINDTTAGIGWSMCRNDYENCTLKANGGDYLFSLDTETLKITVEKAPENVVKTVQNVKVTADQVSATLSWDSLDGALKYWVYKYNEKTGNYACVTSTTATKYTVNGLSPDTEYKFKVCYNGSDYNISSLDEAQEVTVTTLKAADIQEISGTAGLVSAEITWEPVDGAVKYWLYKAWDENGPFYCYDATVDTSYTVRRLQADTDYYFKVITVVESNGKSVLSKLADAPVAHIKTEAAENITVKLDNISTTSATISWPAFENAEQYWIKYSNTTKNTNLEDEWLTYDATTKTSYTFKNLKKNTTYYFTVVAKYPDPQTGYEVANYIAVDTKTLYSDSNFFTFKKSSTGGLTVSWPEDVNSEKSWMFVYDKEGKLVVSNSTTTNSVSFSFASDWENYTYALKTLDADSTGRLITPKLGWAYK